MVALRTHLFPHAWSDMNRLYDEMNRMFRRMERGGLMQPGMSAFPPVNLWQDGDQFYVEAELPGFSLENLDISVTGGNQLVIQGSREMPKLEQGTWHRRERGYGTFARSIMLPQNVDPDRVEATLNNGILTVKLPKHEHARPRRIEVKAS